MCTSAAALLAVVIWVVAGCTLAVVVGRAIRAIEDPIVSMAKRDRRRGEDENPTPPPFC